MPTKHRIGLASIELAVDDPALIREDLRNGRVTLEAAKEHYPHAFETDAAAE